jgi:hypothetical protein
MPTLWNLLQELRKLDVDPGEIRIPAALYDDLLNEAEEISNEDGETPDEDE